MDPSCNGPRTRSHSKPRTPSPHLTGAAANPSVTIPSHRTDQPWNKVARGASTPRNAALPPLRPDHPFESDNQYNFSVPQMKMHPMMGTANQTNSSCQATSPHVWQLLFPQVPLAIFFAPLDGNFLPPTAAACCCTGLIVHVGRSCLG